MKPLSGAVCLLAFAAALSGCGEKEQVVVYKQGQYQGKADSKPWDNESFSGDKGNWEATIKARNQSQNEYRRING
ncbi:hypothetical protein [Methyloversatilis sp. MC4-4]|uniref:hypothetical protein n=1 Tax=Methyloversatilis sp. MC4-4 TaxID=3132824 RepID=UPI003CEE1095